MKNLLPSLSLLCLLVAPAMAQNGDRSLDSTTIFPGQLSFVYPLGTSGAASTQYRYYFSINALIGATGGIVGFEGAGLINTTRGRMTGFQGAGILNTVQGPVKGFQGAGIANLNGDSLTGFSAAGIINMVKKGAKGMAAAGIINTVGGRLDGMAAAGIANVTGKPSKGFMAAGITNITRSLKGAQVAGVLNMADTVDGAQISGVFNIARVVKGVQIGVINLADTMDGIPIGLISLVRRGGYQSIELALSDPGAAQAHALLGVPGFYTQFGAMTYLTGDGASWGPSAGIGMNLNPKGRTAFYLDARAAHVNDPGDGWTDKVREWYSLSGLLGFGKRHTKVVVGPVVNVFLSQQIKGTPKQGFMTYSLWNKQMDNHRIDAWVGVRAGVRL